MSERKYLPTFAELCDRLSIVLLKSIFLPEHRARYLEEIGALMHDIQLLAGQRLPLGAGEIYALLVLMLVNREIWLNEAKARQDASGGERLRFTHSINGIRNIAKNNLADAEIERIDLKIDCFAADLPSEFGNWNLFEHVSPGNTNVGKGRG